MRVCCARSTSSCASASFGESLRRSVFSASARYIAPVSTYTYSSISATRRASVLLPEPTGPSIAIINFLEGRVMLRRDSNPLERFFDFAHGIAQDDGTSVRATHGIFRFRQFSKEPFHFRVIQRSVDLDRSMARS